MEFENVNNFNLALEASLKKQKKMKFSTLVHRLKKLLKRAKPTCTKLQSQEELENEQNELLEAKLIVIQQTIPDQDMKLFNYTTQYQIAQQQYDQLCRQHQHE